MLKKREVTYIFDLLGKDILLQSIDLQPKKIVSVHYVVPERAKRNGVELIGQVTGGNGQLLTEASRIASEKMFVVREIPTVQLIEIEQKGLTKTDVGIAILFG